MQIADPGRVLQRLPAPALRRHAAARHRSRWRWPRSPSLLILDEPTTALDATVEAEVLDLVSALREEFHTSVLFISHNLAVIAKMCDRVGVMYAGELVEQGPAQQVFERAPAPLHRRAAALHPSPWPAQGPRPAGHDPRLPARPRRRCPPGCIFAERCALADERCERGGATDVRGERRRGSRAATTTSRRPSCRGPRRRTSGSRTPDEAAAARHLACGGCRKTFRGGREHGARARRRRSRPAASARRSAWSASRAAARRRWPACCSG